MVLAAFPASSADGTLTADARLTAPRLEVDLDRSRHNARTLVERLGHRGIGVTGGHQGGAGRADVATAWSAAAWPASATPGSRTCEALRAAGIAAPT